MLPTEYKTYTQLGEDIQKLAKQDEIKFNFSKNTSAFRTIVKIIQNLMYYIQAEDIAVLNNLSRDTCDDITNIRVFGPLAGVVKQGATYTKQPMRVHVSKAVSIDENFIVCDSNGIQYKPTQTYTFTEAGTFTKDSNGNDIVFVAVEVGDKQSATNDIKFIITSKDGVDAVNNTEPVLSLGTYEESEESYKNRINEAPRQTNTEGSAEVLQRDLLNIGCTKAKVYVNPTAEKVYDLAKGAMCICLEYPETTEQISKITRIIANNDIVNTKQSLVYDGIDYSRTNLYNYNNCNLPVIWNVPKYTVFFTKIIIYGSQENIAKLDVGDLKSYMVNNVGDYIKFFSYDYDLQTRQYKITDGLITVNNISQIVLNYFASKNLSGLTCGNIRFSKTSSTDIKDFQVSAEHLNELLQMKSDNIFIELTTI